MPKISPLFALLVVVVAVAYALYQRLKYGTWLALFYDIEYEDEENVKE